MVMYKRPMPIITISDQLRFWSKVEKTNTCWLWVGSHNGKGYGHMKINGSTFYVHRISYKLHYKEPNQLEVCHDCHTKLCINPKHLYLGTHSENMQHSYDDNRMSQKGKLNSCALSQDMVNKIVELLNKDIMQKQICEQYNVSRKTVSLIKNGSHWGVR